MTAKILKINDPIDCPYNKNYRTYGIVPSYNQKFIQPDGARNVKMCSALSEFPKVIYCDCRDEKTFPKYCPLKNYEEGEQ